MLVSNLKFNDESMNLIVLGLARECHDFATSRGITSHSVEHQLPLVFSILNCQSGDLLNVFDTSARLTTSIAAVSVSFSDEGYRRIAETAKNRMINSINSDTYIV
jgi:hypothetical protein